MRERRGGRSRIVAWLVASALVIAGCWRGADAPESARLGELVEVADGVANPVAVACQVGVCVAEQVVLPAGRFLDSAADLELPEPLALLAVERLWLGAGGGVFGDGWWSWVDISVRDGQLVGPAPALPVSAVAVGEEVRFSDGSRLSFDDEGQVERGCPSQGFCVDIRRTGGRVRLESEAQDRWVEFSMADGRVMAAVTSDGRVIKYRYRDDRLSEVAAPAGVTSYGYEGEDLSSVVDAAGTRSLTYENGRVSTFTDRDGDTWTFGRRPGVNGATEIHVSRSAGPERTFEFVGTALRRVTDDSGAVLLERRFDDGGLVSESLPSEGIFSTWSPAGVLEVRRQRREGGPAEVLRYQSDPLGRIVEIAGPQGRQQFVYDGSTSLLTAVRTSDDAATSYDYDEHGLLRAVEDPDGHRIELTRNRDGLPVTISDGVVVQRFGYDTNGRITEHSSGDYTTQYRHDQAGRTTTESNGDADRRYRYDVAGRVDQITDSAGIQHLRYDDLGRLIEVSDTTNETVQLDWNGDAIPTASLNGITGPNEEATGVELTPSDDVIAGTAAGSEIFRDQSGTLVAFDGHGRPVAVQTAAGVMRRRFNEDGHLVALSLPDGRSFQIERSAAGRPLTVTDDAGRRSELSWNGTYLERLVTPSGVEVDYSWNSAGQLAAVAAGPSRWTYRYDEYGNLAEVATPQGQAHYEWDLAGRPLQTTGPNGLDTAYQWAGELLQAVTVDGDDVVALEWDELDRVTRVATTDGDEKFGYDDTGNLTSHDVSGAGKVEYTYRDGRVTELRAGSRTERWTWTGDSVSDVRTGDDPDDHYSLTWAYPGQLEGIEREGSPIVTIERNETGVPVTVESTDDDGKEEVASFAWAADRSLTNAAIDDRQLRLQDDPDGRITLVRTDDMALAFTYQDGAPTRIHADSLSLEFEYADGVLSRSTFERGEESAVLDWDVGQRIASFSSSQGDGKIGYLSDGRVNTIAYDDQVRDVDYDDDGRAESPGTGGELLADLFDDNGRATSAPAAAGVGPMLPYLLRLPVELGVSVPTVATPADVIDAFLDANVPVAASPLIGNGNPDDLARRAADAILVGGATYNLPTGPTTSLDLTLSPRTEHLETLLREVGTTTAASSILERLSPDPCLVCRVGDAAVNVLAGVGSGSVSVWRFVRDNPLVQAALIITFLSLEAIPAGIASTGLLLLVLIDPSDVTGSIHSALLAPSQAFLRLVSGPNLADLVLVTLTAASVASGAGRILRPLPLPRSSGVDRLIAPSRALTQRAARVVDELPCRLDRVVCVSRTRFGAAATHIDDARATGQPRFLTTDYAGAAARRRDALRGVARVTGFDLDEYPLAFTRQGGTGASIRAIDPSANRAAGAYIRSQLPSAHGYRFLIRTVT